MKTLINALAISLVTVLFVGCNEGNGTEQAKDSVLPEFKGKNAKSYEESVEWWPEKQRPPEGAPNVIIFLLDDVGFAQIENFGGLIETPNIDKLAANGLRYNN